MSQIILKSVWKRDPDFKFYTLMGASVNDVRPKDGKGSILRFSLITKKRDNLYEWPLNINFLIKMPTVPVTVRRRLTTGSHLRRSKIMSTGKRFQKSKSVNMSTPSKSSKKNQVDINQMKKRKRTLQVTNLKNVICRQ